MGYRGGLLMAYGDNKQQNRSIADVLSDFTKFQHDNLTNERNYNQNVLNNMATIGKYQRDIRTQNMFMKRANATQRFLEAEQFARAETDESKLPKWLEIMNQARREIGSTEDNESGFKQEGMLRELTMDDLLSMRRMDQMEKKANGEIPTSGRLIVDKIRGLGGIDSASDTTNNDTPNNNAFNPWPFDIYGNSLNRDYVNANGYGFPSWAAGTGANYRQEDSDDAEIGKYRKLIDRLNKELILLDPNDEQVPYIAKNINALHNAILDIQYRKKNSVVKYKNLEDFRKNRGWDIRGTYDERIKRLKQRFKSGNIDYNQYVSAIDMINQEEQRNYDVARNNDGASLFDRLKYALNIGRR